MKRCLAPLATLLLAGCIFGSGGGEDDSGFGLDPTDDPIKTAPSLPTTDTATTADPTQAVDEFIQVQATEVDVLFIIDNSCSMWEEQTALVDNFPVFMDYFLGSGLDYHIGVISTDMTDASHSGRLRPHQGYRFIDDQTANASSVFAGMAAMGTSGHWNEKGRDAGFEALVPLANGFNVGFLRPTSSLHIIVLSDEDDHSTNLTNADWVGWLQTEQGVRPGVTLSAIVGQAMVNGVSEIGTEYIQATNQVGGILWPVNNANYDLALEQIGIANSGLVREFALSEIPVLGTIEVEVEVDGVVSSFLEWSAWEYQPDANSVLFLEYVPSPQAIIRISYTIDTGV